MRSSGYVGKVDLAFGGTELEDTKKIAVDHIMELWEVKRAYYRATRYFEQFENPAQWMEVQKTQEYSVPGWDSTKKYSWPQKEDERLLFLKQIQTIFNGPNNLCIIPTDFNLQKNMFLSWANYCDYKDQDVNIFRVKLWHYYDTTEERRLAISKTLLDAFYNNNNLMFWAMDVILEQDRERFLLEKLQGPELALKEALPWLNGARLYDAEVTVTIAAVLKQAKAQGLLKTGNSKEIDTDVDVTDDDD